MSQSIIFEAIQERLSAISNPEYAQKMKDYMKGNFDFYGVMATPRKEVQKSLNPILKGINIDDKLMLIQNLWNTDKRELHYYAIELLTSIAKKLDATHLPMVERLILTNSWWDSVDALAPNVAGMIFKNHNSSHLEWVEKWNNDSNLWLRRSAIIHQLRYKKPDLDLLFAIVESHKGSKEFFINKACGWALREASKKEPARIREFIYMHDDLSKLTIKEGSKYL